MFTALRRAWSAQRSLAGELGWPQSLYYRLHCLCEGRIGRRPLSPLWSRCSRYPLWYRPGTTDLCVFHQIFVWREYRCLDYLDPRSVGLVIDCGAYAGYSSAYFLTRFPDCRVVALEPDEGNHALALRNLSPYGDRVRLVRAGVWSEPAALEIDDVPFGDGREWARHLRPAGPEGSSLRGMTVGSLLDGAACDRVSIVKVDIEGSEIQVFAGDNAWLDRVDILVIELHGPECEAALLRAVAGRGFVFSQCFELTICRRQLS